MNRAQQILDELLDRRRNTLVEDDTAQGEQGSLMNPAEIENFVLSTLGWGDLIKLSSWIDRGLYVSGSVSRHSSHYVHENTVSFELEVDGIDDFPEEEHEDIEKVANEVEERVSGEVKNISQKIYRALEREWEWTNSDEVIDDTINANEYAFDESGERDNSGGFTFDQLDDAAKEKAREWLRDANEQDPDTYWSEPIIDEWKTELEEMGFLDPEISWMGFWSQGDGASFTCNRFDFDKFFKFFTSGHSEARGHPYSDEKYAGQDNPVPESLDKLGVITGGVGRSTPLAKVCESSPVNSGADIEKFTRDTIYSDFSVIATLIPTYSSYKNPNEKKYAQTYTSKETYHYVGVEIYDSTSSTGEGSVSVAVRSSILKDSFPVIVHRKAIFYVPKGSKPKLVELLLDYWNGAKSSINRPVSPGREKKLAVSIANRLSALAGLWRKNILPGYEANLDDRLKKYLASLTPGQKAALEKKRLKWLAKTPNPSDDEIKLWGEMKKWEAEPPGPQQESDDMLDQMANVAVRAAVNDLGTFMDEQPVRYMSGSRHYEWSSTTPDWTWKVIVRATVYSDELANQPWDAEIVVKDNSLGKSFRVDKLIVTPDEKNVFGIQMRNLIGQVSGITEQSWDELADLLREIEKAFNSSLGKRQSDKPKQFSSFYTY